MIFLCWEGSQIVQLAIQVMWIKWSLVLIKNLRGTIVMFQCILHKSPPDSWRHIISFYDQLRKQSSLYVFSMKDLVPIWVQVVHFRYERLERWKRLQQHWSTNFFRSYELTCNFHKKNRDYSFTLYLIKPHYHSEGPRQGSCGVFGGCFILSRLILWSI